jgi:hypothetical protein
VGAHHVLGPLLWSPEGKCLLALAYTATVAAFGRGLIRWGAEGAGRVMLVTTLIVVPVNFALAGELRLLLDPTAPHLVVALLISAVLLTFCARIPAALYPRGTSLFPAAFFILGLLNAATSRGMLLGWGYAALVISGLVFAGAVWRLNTRRRSEAEADQRSFAGFALGLLAYGFLFGMLRTALWVLPPVPTLYALPVMLAAIAAAHTAHHFPRLDGRERDAALLRWVAHLLAGAAFALALARPPEPSALYSGNTLATALLGLALFATALRLYRRPAYLYAAFGALFVAYFGAGYFIGDVVAALEQTASRALGYEGRLPLPFKSLNGLAFNAVLALLALYFTRRWQEPRLARHCHVIGLPLSLLACCLSGFEPKAAVLCLAAYTALYALAAWLFARPSLLYLACASLAGAAFFGATLLALPPDAQALGAAGMALLFWLLSRALEGKRSAGHPPGDADQEVGATSAFTSNHWTRPYGLPLVHASLAMSAAALATATLAILALETVSLAVLLSLLIVSLLYFRIDARYPSAMLAFLAVITANITFMLAVVHIHAWWLSLFGIAPFGLAAAVAGAAQYGLARWAATQGSRTGATDREDAHQPPSGWQRYTYPLLHVALAQATLAVATSGVAVLGASAEPSAYYGILTATLTIAALTFWAATRFYPASLLVRLGLGSALTAWLSAFQWAMGSATPPPAVYGIVVALFALAVWGLGAVCRRRSAVSLHAAVCFEMSALLGLLIVPLSYASPPAMLLVAALCLLAVQSLGTAEWLYAVLGALGCALYFAFFAGPPGAALVVACVVAAFALWTLGVLVARIQPALRVRLQLPDRRYEIPLFNGALVASLLALALRIGGSLWHGDAWTAHVALLPALALFYLLMLRPYPHRAWVHAAIALITLAISLTADPLLALLEGNHGGVALRGLLIGMGLALCWRLAERGLAPAEEPLCRRLGLRSEGYAAVVGAWARAAFSTTALLLVALVAATAGRQAFATGASDAMVLPLPTGIAALGSWSCVALALFLAAGYALLHTRALSTEALLLALRAVLLLIAWWLGAPASPLIARLGVNPLDYFPLATAGLALAVTLMDTRGKPSAVLGQASFAATLAAVAFTRGSVSGATVVTLLLATTVCGLLAAAQQQVRFGYAGSAAFVATCVYALLAVTGTAGSAGIAGEVAVAAVAAALALLAASATLRARWGAPVPLAPSSPASPHSPHTAGRRRSLG